MTNIKYFTLYAPDGPHYSPSVIHFAVSPVTGTVQIAGFAKEDSTEVLPVFNLNGMNISPHNNYSLEVARTIWKDLVKVGWSETKNKYWYTVA